MTSWQRYLGIAAGIGIVVAVLSAAGGGSALAQGALKPLSALIVNNATQPVPVALVGEPHQAPFSYDQVGTCNDYNCFMDFPVVPAGKRLVIQHVGAIARPSAATTIVDLAELVTNNTEDPNYGVRNTFGMTLIGQVGQNIIANTYGMNQPVLAFVNAGSYARITLSTRNGGNVFFSQATISGYMVDAE
jgi:hypothetical protein